MRELSIPEKHQLAIARKTLTYDGENGAFDRDRFYRACNIKETQLRRKLRD